MLAAESNAPATPAVPPIDFMTYLAGRGALRDNLKEDGAGRGRHADGSAASVDWSAVTKLTPSALADELAGFYQCDRVRRDEQVTQLRVSGYSAPGDDTVIG